ncbi:MAG TPA: Gfo/Idh/MocA family oxidoreductase [Anaerolineae bacterium]|jgi:predicted dehydrogenase
MSDSIGVALIGTGMFGKRLAEVIKRLPSLRLVTCYSRNQEKRAAFASEFECEAASSFEAAIEHPEVQGVLLITPNNVHAEQSIACAERGKHIFVEKPIADTMADGQAIQAACASAGITLQVGHCCRRLGAARKVKELLTAGRLGQVVLAEANFSLPSTLTPDKWRYYRETCPGGPLMQLGVHHADTLQYWLGPVKRVHGSFARLSTEAEIDDVGSVLIEFENGARGTLNSSYVSPKTFYLRLFGTEANLFYETDMSIWPNAEKMDPATTLTLQTKSGSETIEFETRDMLMDELDEFARCIRGEAVPETGAAEGLAALQVIRGALESHENG